VGSDMPASVESGGVTASAPSEAGGGVLSDMGKWWGNQSDMTQYGVLQMGGSMLQGYAQEEMLKDKMRRERKQYKNQRRRRASVPDMEFTSGKRYVPGRGWVDAQAPTNRRDV